jgi:hypothetical protein
LLDPHSSLVTRSGHGVPFAPYGIGLADEVRAKPVETGLSQLATVAVPSDCLAIGGAGKGSFALAPDLAWFALVRQTRSLVTPSLAQAISLLDEAAAVFRASHDGVPVAGQLPWGAQRVYAVASLANLALIALPDFDALHAFTTFLVT